MGKQPAHRPPGLPGRLWCVALLDVAVSAAVVCLSEVKGKFWWRWGPCSTNC